MESSQIFVEVEKHLINCLIAELISSNSNANVRLFVTKLMNNRLTYFRDFSVTCNCSYLKICEKELRNFQSANFRYFSQGKLTNLNKFLTNNLEPLPPCTLSTANSLLFPTPILYVFENYFTCILRQIYNNSVMNIFVPFCRILPLI